jgi:hypothetical protein
LFDVRRFDDVVIIGENHEVRKTLRRQQIFATFFNRRLKVADDVSTLVDANVGDFLASLL